jgi:hypothetical protein
MPRPSQNEPFPDETESAEPGEKKPHRSTPEIAADTIRRCRNEDCVEIANFLVDKAPGMAMDLKVALERELAEE